MHRRRATLVPVRGLEPGTIIVVGSMGYLDAAATLISSLRMTTGMQAAPGRLAFRHDESGFDRRHPDRR
jgi:hypothetical protein